MGSQAADLESQIAKLGSYLRRWGLRLRLAESLTWGPWGAAAGLSAGLVLALAARLWPFLMARALVGLGGVLALSGVALGLAAAWLRPRRLHGLARTFDHRFGLAERLTTAVEIGAGRLRTTPAMAAAQLADGLDGAARVDLRAMLPLRASRRALFALGVLTAALALALWLPNPQEDVLLQRAAVRAAVEEQIEELRAVRKEVAEAEGLTEAEREMLLQALEEAMAALASGLDEGRATPEGAVAALSEAEQALAPLQDPGAAAVQAGLARAAEGLADSELTRDIAALLARGDYRAAAQALSAYADMEGEPLTREQELELAWELGQAAEALAESEPGGSTRPAGDLAEQLARAAQAIERGDVAEAREAIWEAAQCMGEVGERVQRQDTVESTLAQLQEGRERVAQAGGAGPGAGRSPGGRDVGGQMAQQGGQPSVGGQAQPGHDEDTGTGAPYDEVYVPYRVGEEGIGVDVGREDLGDAGAPVGDMPLPVLEGGRASVPYREVYADYADQASAALEGSYIPLGLKRYVRDYFSSLEP
jgi:hypothetical protein